MDIKFHNYAEIDSGGKVKRYYNQMLGGLNQKFLSGKSITGYIAFGSGRRQDLQGVSSLADFRGAVKAEVCAHNYDISKGAIFIKKMIKLGDDYNGAEITELAFSPNADGSDIINYIPVDGIVKLPGKPMIITMVLYLTLETEGNGQICAGDNPIFEILLGGCDINDVKVTAVMSDNVTEQGKKGEINIYGQSQGSLSFTGNSLQLAANLPPLCDSKEVIIMVNGKPCVSFFSRDYSSLDFEEIKSFYIDRGVAVVKAAGVKGISGMRKGTQVLSSYVLNIPSNMCGGYKNVFENIITEKDTVKCSPNGKYLAIFSHDDICVYDALSLNKMVFSHINFELDKIIDFFVDNLGNFFVRLSDYPYFAAYKKDGYVLRPCTVNAEIPQNIFYYSAGEFLDIYFVHYLFISEGETVHRCVAGYIDGFTYQEMLFRERRGNFDRIFFDMRGDKVIYLNTRDRTVTPYPEFDIAQNVKELLYDCDEAQLLNELLFIRKDGKWRLFYLDRGEEEVLYKSGVRRVYVSQSGIIFKLFSNNKFTAYYSNNLSNSVHPIDPPQKFHGGRITCIYPTSQGALVCVRGKSPECYYFPFNTDKVIIRSPNNEGAVTATVRRNSFKNLSGRQIKLQISFI